MASPISQAIVRDNQTFVTVPSVGIGISWLYETFIETFIERSVALWTIQGPMFPPNNHNDQLGWVFLVYDKVQLY